ncbi:hypothetical protein [Streptomyces sp. NPDC020965]|uniref:hypothetical protein n=1 Tax=Streptomyces sp. NPDC020965 TaxID=3365105 RepID=UPI0037A9E80A
MRSALWLLFAIGIATNVYASTFADVGGAADIGLRVVSAVILLIAGTGLWRTRANRTHENRAR